MTDDMEKIEMMFMTFFARYISTLKNLDKYTSDDMNMMERNLRGIWMSGLYTGVKLKGAPAHMTAPLSVN